MSAVRCRVAFVEHIFHHALTRPEKPAIVLADRVVTYDMVAQAILRIEDRLRALKLAAGELVCVVIDNPIRHMIVAAAALRLGHPVMSAEKTADIVPHRLPVRTFLQGEPGPLLPGLRQVVVGDDWFAGDRRPLGGSATGFAREDDICRVDLSSGTTGRPKALSLSLRAFHQWTMNYYTAIGLGTWDRLLCLPGLTSSWGFTMAAHALMAGRTMLRASGPREALHMISVYGADALVASSQQLRELVRVQSETPLPCTSLRVIMTAGGLISRQLMLEARAKLCSAIVNQYGSSEAGSTAYALADQIAAIEGATGFVVPGAEVEIVGDNDEPLPAETEGAVRVRAPWLAQPFPPGASHAQTDIRAGWFYPGDRGRMRSDGLLILTGRTSQIINAGGLKLAPEVIEDTVLQHPTVAEAAAFGAMGTSGIEDIYLAIVPRAPLADEQLIAWCGERNLPIARVFTLDTLPKGANGKVQRDELKRRLLAH